MGSSDTDKDARETWEKEVLAEHRWEWHGDETAAKELERLRVLWNAAQPADDHCRKITDQIVALEICNWNLEENLLALCGAIGSQKPLTFPTGHLPSVSDERWKKMWAYYLTLRDRLSSEGRSGYGALLRICDPDGEIERHVLQMLGDRDELKELYVERFCLCLEYWLGGFFPRKPAQMTGHGAAVSAAEEEIRKRDPEGRILNAMRIHGGEWLGPCSHKAFGRYDDIIASIGAGEWHGRTHWPVDDGLRRADNIDAYLSAIDAWISGKEKPRKGGAEGPSSKIHAALGDRDAAKVFLASLLVSLLRAQVLTARSRLKARAEKEASGNADSR